MIESQFFKWEKKEKMEEKTMSKDYSLKFPLKQLRLKIWGC